MTDKKDVISYEESQKLPEEEKQNFNTNRNSDSKSDTATGKGAKLPEVKSTTPVTGMNQADPSTSRTTETVKDATADAEAKGKAEDKANQMHDSLKAKTDTTATDKSIDQSQIDKKNDFDEQNKTRREGLKQQEKQITEIKKRKEAALVAKDEAEIKEKTANEALEKARKELNQVKQETDEALKYLEKYDTTGKTLKERLSFKNLKNSFEHTNDVLFGNKGNGKGKFENYRDRIAEIARENGIEIEDISKDITGPDTLGALKTIINNLEAREQEALTNQQEAQKVAESARNRLAEVTTEEQEAQAKYDKDQKDYKPWKAENEEDVKVQDEVLDEKQEALDKVLERAKIRRGELDEEWDKLLEDNEKELDKHKDAAELSDFLPRFAIQHYLEGDFGERKTAKALGTLGYFLLDKIGASLVNASQVARGMSPTQKTVLEQYNTKMMEAAINRDDKNRSKINEERINTVIKNSDALRAAGYDTEVTLGNDMVSKYLEQHADQVDELAYLKLKKQAAEWYDNLTDAEKMEVDRLFLAISTNPDERQRGILQYQISGYEVLGQTDEAKKQQARYAQAEAKAKTMTVERLTRAQAARAEQEIENMKKSGLLTDAQVADAWKMVDLHQKDLNWKDAQEFQKQVTGYLGAAGNLIPGL